MEREAKEHACERAEERDEEEARDLARSGESQIQVDM